MSHLTAMAGIYLASALLAVPWALGWGQQNGGTWWWAIPAGAWSAFLLSLVPYFDAHGRPPPAFAVLWRHLSRGLETWRDSVRGRWALRVLLDGVVGERAVVWEAATDVVRLGVLGSKDLDDDELVLRLWKQSIVVVRHRRTETTSTRVYRSGTLRRALKRVGICTSEVDALLDARDGS